ncbi:hypothetical protein ABZ153_10070 [Streptomyces sp. NPDC006290]|uniref:hypothetical protein n=1 Tax=Streptomyces sp. NPDC006290 TaxID=3156745 RepID=UPI0033B87505
MSATLDDGGELERVFAGKKIIRIPWRCHQPIALRPVGAGSPASIHPHVVSEMRWIRADDFAMPAPVRYRSTAAPYEDGGVDRGTTRRAEA